MNRNDSKVRWTVRILWGVLTLSLPFALLWLSAHEPGINLGAATSSRLSLGAFAELLVASQSSSQAFRLSIIRSILYSGSSAFLATATAVNFTFSLVGISHKKATSLAFVLLSIALLPQTFLILSVISLARSVGITTANPLMIILLLSVVLMPVACWATYMLIGRDIRKLLYLAAEDSLQLREAFKITLAARVDFFGQVFLLCFTLGLGNFLIPFALGDNRTYTAIVYIQSFSSNLGRDWATVSAAGVLLLFPILLISIFIGKTIVQRIQP
ncbi:MAG: hypothetical protein AAFZ17_09110 [Cyanobacteria bacterium J06650_10]